MIRDNSDRVVALLEQIAQGVNGGSSGDTTINREQNITVPGESGQQSAEYFSTGANPVAISAQDEWSSPLEMGLVAKTINIRSTGDLLIAFSNPNNESNHIFLAANETPFSIGGETGIDTSSVWFRKPADATEDPEVRVIAYR